jgi:hypothetical protein
MIACAADCVRMLKNKPAFVIVAMRDDTVALLNNPVYRPARIKSGA